MYHTATAYGEKKVNANGHGAPTVLIVPGLRDHMPAHWQTILEQKLANAKSVPRMERDAIDKLSCEAWVDRLDRAIAEIEGPVVLVAHSAGCMIVVHWAFKYRRAIQGALLATPADLELPLPEGYPKMEALRENGWTPIPRGPLPFRSIVAASTNDPLGRFERIALLAAHWGSDLVNLGAVGHLNPAAGYGEWPQAESLIRDLC
jgi:predicted alpha/beta hydrolase family esterase